jgi:hypothetical protein
MIPTEPNQALRDSVDISVTFEKDAVTMASFSHFALIVLGLIIIGVGVTGLA